MINDRFWIAPDKLQGYNYYLETLSNLIVKISNKHWTWLQKSYFNGAPSRPISCGAPVKGIGDTVSLRNVISSEVSTQLKRSCDWKKKSYSRLKEIVLKRTFHLLLFVFEADGRSLKVLGKDLVEAVNLQGYETQFTFKSKWARKLGKGCVNLTPGFPLYLRVGDVGHDGVPEPAHLPHLEKMLKRICEKE